MNIQHLLEPIIVGLPFVGRLYVFGAVEILFYILLRRRYPWKHSLASAAMGIVGLVTFAYTSIPITALHDWVWNHRLFNFNQSTWVVSVSALVIGDFLFYVNHRVSHTVNWQWAEHSAHHACQRLTFFENHRSGWLNIAITIWVTNMIPMWFGFSPASLNSASSIIFVYVQLLHTELVPKLGIIDFLFQTPSIHRIHHATNPRYIDKNFGAITTIWDHAFGTYQREQETPVLGLGYSFADYHHPVRLATQGWKRLIKEISSARGVSQKFLVMVGRPSDSPEPNDPVKTAA